MKITIETNTKDIVVVERKGFIQLMDYVEVFKGALVAIGFPPKAVDEELNQGEWFEENNE